VPKILSLGLEIKTKTDPGYCAPAIRKSLINHLLNPKAVSTVAAAYSARESELVKGIAEELGSEVVSFDSEKIAKTKVPMEMTFSPEKKADSATALALLASQSGTILIRRSTSAQGLVFSVAESRTSIILPE
jgi:cobalamin biosynthesis protein CbiG